MTRVARRVGAVPVRTASEAWEFIVGMITTSERSMHADLVTAGNAAAMLISEEHTSMAPILLSGCGPQVRIYTLHGDRALDDGSGNEMALNIMPSDSWELALPATGTDFALAAAEVGGLEHITIYDPTVEEPSADSSSNGDRRGRIHLDLGPLEE